jgi:uncharacterized glyoxalase superfamily protein PhnB
VTENRSVPSASVIPVLAYQDAVEASDWLCRAFGFAVRLRIGTHRVQLVLADGAVIAADGGASGSEGLSVLVRVDDADAHCKRAAEAGARITSAPTDYPYGERQYSAIDLGGHHWTFSQSIADVDPADWGGELVADATS